MMDEKFLASSVREVATEAQQVLSDDATSRAKREGVVRKLKSLRLDAELRRRLPARVTPL